ncbi:MAG: hypothetical protein CBD74_14230 [Saprospirales bacterium TMED214]|nr:MAG: hypothetical protein CBD74_14230 [Saprospirales bacterium TMED214]
MTRTAEIANVSFIRGNQEDMYCVYLYENGDLIEIRPLKGKSIHYAEDVVENWQNGLIKNPHITVLDEDDGYHD